MIITAIICKIRPDLGGPSRSFTWRQRLEGLPHLIPVFMVFAIIIVSIYRGWATPTEAAAVGVAMAMAIAAFYKALTPANMRAALLGTIRTTALVMFVIVGAYFLNYALGATGLGRQLNTFLNELGLGPYGMLLVIILMYIVLGFFIETLALMIATIPIVVPIVAGLGFDKVWFGILLIVLIEMALITPPVGLNLYVVQGARKGGRLGEVMMGVIPYVLVMLAMVALLVAVPGIALFFKPV
jgi:tripartite ATP-independent transporter DctM subunit